LLEIYLTICEHAADSRTLIHLQDTLDNGATTCLVRTVYTDVVAILSFVGKFQNYLSVWLAFGAGKWFRHIHVNAIYNALGKHKSIALPVFHSCTGCDKTSAFGKGKKSVWDAWNSFPEVTNTFLFINSHPHTLLSNDNEHFNASRMVLYCNV